MKKFKAIIFSLLWSILVICFPVISGVIVSIIKMSTIQQILIQAASLFLGFLIGILIIVIKKKKIKENYLSHTKYSWFLYIPAILLFIPTSIQGFIWKGTGYFFSTMALYLLVGITEELYFRYFVVEELNKEFDSKYIILIGTILFGFGHLSSALSGTDFIMTLLIVINALLFGFMANVLILNSKNIIPLMILHFLFDFESKFIVLEGSSLAIAEFIRGVFMLLYGIVIIIITYIEPLMT